MSEDVAVNVYVRVRPLNDREPESSWWYNEASLSCNGEKHQQRAWSFGEGHVFVPETTTQHVYDTVARPVVEKALEGYHGYVFAYGQTSSGKTHTMLGQPTNPGIIPLALKDIFSNPLIVESNYVVRVSYLEIYNEQVRDLLDPKKGILDVYLDEKRVPMIFVGKLQTSGREKTKIEATSEVVRNAEDALSVIKRGEANRHYGATKMNVGSSRSHTIFRLEISHRDPKKKTLRSSELFLVDLAGMENIKKSAARGSAAGEAGAINKSLLSLEKVVRALDEAAKGKDGAGARNAALATRESKLTRFLKPALGGNSRTAIICTVTSAQVHISETVTTLDFASRAMNIRNRCRVNEVAGNQEKETQLMRAYKEQVEDIKDRLSRAQAREAELLSQKEEMERAFREELERLRSSGASEGMINERQAEHEAELARALEEQLGIQKDLEEKMKMIESLLHPEQEKRMIAEQEREIALKELEDQLHVRQSNEATIAELHATIQRLQQEAEERAETETKLRDQIDALELSLDEATETLTGTMLNQDEVRQHITEIEEEKAQLVQQLQDKQKLLADSEEMIKLLKSSAPGLDVTLSSDKELLSARLERDGFHNQLTELQKQLKEAEEREKEAVKDRTSIQAHNEQLQQYCSRLRLQLEEATRRLKLMAEKNSSEGEISNLRLGQSTATTQLQAYEKMQEEQRQRIVALECDKMNLQRDLEDLKAGALHKMIDALKQERDQLKVKVVKLQKENSTAKLLNSFPTTSAPRLPHTDAEIDSPEKKSIDPSQIKAMLAGKHVTELVGKYSSKALGSMMQPGSRVMAEMLRIQEEQAKQAKEEAEEASAA